MGQQEQKPSRPKSAGVASTAPPPLFLRPILNLDATVSLHLHTLTKPFAPRPFLRFLELLADFRFFFPVSLSFLLASPSSSRLRTHLFLPLTLCSLLDLIFIALLKLLTRRPRPAYSVHGDYNAVVSVDHFSFPSGHSSRVFFVASLFYLAQQQIVDAVADLNHQRVTMLVNRWIRGDEVLAVKILISAVWTWALATAVSRIALGRHYVIDVLCGACFGILEALLTLRALRFLQWI